jgi:hypothetical protein
MLKATPEDLTNTVVAADDLRRQLLGQRSASYRPGQRVWIEPFFNLLGFLWGELTLLLPWPLRKPYVQWVVRKMGGHPPEDNPDLTSRITETIRLAQDLKARTGQWPALLVLMSHPETEGPLQWLRFELMRQGLQVADAMVDAGSPGAWYPEHPRCLLAIDPFALDTVSAAVGGFYAAWMHRFFLAYDRQPSTQSWLQRHLFLQGSKHHEVSWKFLKLLKANAPILMAMGGGLPYNACLLYTAREFVQRLSLKRWTLTKREAQLELMKILMKPEGDVWPADKGELPAGKIQDIREALLRWGLAPQGVEGAMNEFVEEFKLPVPYRARLFRVLGKRLVARGKPLLLVPVSHRNTPPHIQIASPVAIEKSTEDFASFGKILASVFAGISSGRSAWKPS